MRKRIVAGNWKMNKTPSEAKALASELLSLIKHREDVEVVFCVPYVDIAPVFEVIQNTTISLGAQNLYLEESGAYTGEISPSMIRESGCTHVIIGHSERRAYFGETDEIVNAKVKKAFEHDLIPIICVGETLTQREQGITKELVRLQTKVALLDISPEKASLAVIAYEPIWAIGTGHTATNEQAEEVCAWIREVLFEMYGKEVSERIRIQYGGSVNASNAEALFSMPNIDGGLVGGASLKADFSVITNAK